MSEDERRVVFEDMQIIDVNPSTALCWALDRFNALFRDSVQDLLRAHPPDEVEDQGEGTTAPFWGGARRLPTPLKFDAGNSQHRTFILLAATLWGRGRGADGEVWERDHMEEALEDMLLKQAEQSSNSNNSTSPMSSRTTKTVSEAELIAAIRSLDARHRANFMSDVVSQEFEKVY